MGNSTFFVRAIALAKFKQTREKLESLKIQSNIPQKSQLSSVSLISFKYNYNMKFAQEPVM